MSEFMDRQAKKLYLTGKNLVRVAESNRRARTARVTRKRLQEWESQEKMARDRWRQGQMMMTLATWREEQKVPPILREVRNTTQVKILAERNRYPSGPWSEREQKQMAKAGLHDDTLFQHARLALLEAIPEDTDHEMALHELREMALRLRGIPGYFPTPETLAQRIGTMAHLDNPGLTILEPSAGSGNLVRMALAYGHENTHVVAIEANHELAALTSEIQPAHPTQRLDVFNADFMTWEPNEPPLFDRVIMNPPFERGQEIDHVRRAYEYLDEGGILVSIMSTGPFQRGLRQDTEFRDWLEGLDHTVTYNEADAFKSVGTTVATALLVIDKEANK